MFLEGDTEVFLRLNQKKQLFEAGDSRHEAIRPLLLILGGTMRGVYGGGQVCALEKLGFTEIFDEVIGVSTGAPTAAYFVGKQAALGTSVYCEECTTPRFLSGNLIVKMNGDYLAAIFRGHEGAKALDQAKVRMSRSSVYVAVTCARTGEGSFINIKTARPDMIQPIRASFAIPGISGPAVPIDDDLFLDGIGAYSFPVRQAIERFDPTDVLVLANAPPPSHPPSSLEHAMFALLTAAYPKPVREAFANNAAQYAAGLTWLREKDPCRTAIIWSDSEVGLFERQPEKLVAAAERAQLHLLQVLVNARSSIL